MTDTIEPITINFTTRERDGETIVKTDSLTDLAVAGAYDAIRLRTLASDNNDGETVATATAIIHSAKPRAVESAKALAREAGTRQEEAFRPGGDRRIRHEARAALKAALRAYRVAKA